MSVFKIVFQGPFVRRLTSACFDLFGLFLRVISVLAGNVAIEIQFLNMDSGAG